MTNSDWIAMGGASISAAAFLFSIFSWRKSGHTAKRLLEIEEAREQDRRAEEESASLVAHFENESDKLVVENRGRGEASSIVISLDGVRIEEHDNVIADAQPFAIGPGGKVSYPLAIESGFGPPFGVCIAWEDAGVGIWSWESEVS